MKEEIAEVWIMHTKKGTFDFGYKMGEAKANEKMQETVDKMVWAKVRKALDDPTHQPEPPMGQEVE